MSIRHRRVRSSLLHEWGPKARRKPETVDPASFGTVGVELSCVAFRERRRSHEERDEAGAVTPARGRPFRVGAQFADFTLYETEIA